jgi:hypothetical protein
VGSISIGADTLNGGNSNIYIGYGTGISAGNNNIFIGPGIVPASNTSNTLIIGNGGTPTIIGDLVGHRVGINMSSLPVTTPPVSLDIDGYARVQNGGLGMKKLPGSYSLDVNGDMQVSDGYGVLTFTHDSSNNSVTTISNTTSYPNCNATLRVTGGFFSANGITTTSGFVIPLKKGMFMVSTYVSGTEGSNHGYVGIAYNLLEQNLISSNAGSLLTSNVIDHTLTINNSGIIWTVTYFPSL